MPGSVPWTVPTSQIALGTMPGRRFYDVDVGSSLAEYLEELGESAGRALALFNVNKMKKPEEGTGTQLLQALGATSFLAAQAAPRPRLLGIMVQDSANPAFHKASSSSLHICKPVTVAAAPEKEFKSKRSSKTPTVKYEGGKTYALRRIQEFRILNNEPPSGEGKPAEDILELRITSDVLGSDGAVTMQIVFHSVEHRMAFIALTLQLLRLSNDRLPKLQIGGSITDVDKWWKSNQESVVKALGDWGAGVLERVDTYQQSGKAPSVLVSAKEERDLEELLEMYAMGLGEVDGFESRLQEEHEALEAANIHSIFSSAPLADAVVVQLRKTRVMLEDIDENLMVFDTKLRLMREDIAAIETSNNSLQLQARNNNALLGTLKSLLSDLKVSRDIQLLLENPPFDDGSRQLGNIVKAAEALHGKLQRMTPGSKDCLSPHLLNMSVVREAYNTGSALASRFVKQATSYLGALINQAVDTLVQEVGRAAGASRITPPDHSSIHAIGRKYASLVSVLRQLDAKRQYMPRLHAAYGQAVNMLIRRELRTACSVLRKAAQLEMHNNPVNYSLTKDAGAVIMTTEGGHRDRDDKSDGFDDRASSHDDRMSMISASLSGGKAHSVISYSTATSIIMVPKRRGGTYDGVSLSVPLNEAFQSLLDGFIPFLHHEAEMVASFLMLYENKAREEEKESSQASGRASPQGMGRRGKNQGAEDKASAARLSSEGAAVMEQLFAGIEPEFQVLVDMASKGHQVLCLPMLASTSRWLSEMLSQPTGAALAKVLALCHERLRTSFATFVSQQMNEVAAYTRKAKDGVRDMHVVAFISQFALMSHHIEMMLRSTRGEKVNDVPDVVGLLEDFSSRDRELVKSSALWQPDDAVDELYRQLVGQMFSSLEDMASMDTKHGERLRLENYTYFVDSVRPLVAHVEVLEPYLMQAEIRQVESMRAYVQQQLEWGRFWALLDFSQKLDQKLDLVTTPAEVTFQSGCSASDVKSLLSSSMKEADKKLRSMYARVKKHMETPVLTSRVWEEIQEELLTRYERLDEQVALCYPTSNINLRPSPENLAQLLVMAARTG